MTDQTADLVDAVWEDSDNWSWVADSDNKIYKCETDDDCPGDDSNVYPYQSDGNRVVVDYEW